jgi:DNA-binding response OmpR family regulator
MVSLYIDEHKLDSASKYIDQCLSTAYEINSFDHLVRIHELNAKLHEERGEAEEALQNYHYSQSYKDSVDFEDSQSHVQNIRVGYEENKAKVAEENAKTEKKIRNLILYSALTIIILIIILLLFFFRWIKERRKSADALEKIDKERQDFYRGVTHQLRTPLTVVIGMTEQLRKYLPSDSRIAQREFDAVERQSQNLLKLITEMIEYSKNNTSSNILTELPTPNNDQNEELAKLNEGYLIMSEANNEIPDEDEDNRNYILLAEDDPDIALLITEMLKNEGYHYSWAKDGQEAWEMMHNKMPDLLITDIMMPRKDGLELMKNIREDDSINHLPIIVVSARVDNKDRLVGIEAGAEVYLGKPFIPNELLLRVRKLLEQRQILRTKFLDSISNKNHNENVSPANAQVEGNKKLYDKKEEKQEEKKNGEIKMSDKENAFIERINYIIKKNMSDPNFSSASLADQLNTTTGTLNRKLKNLTDIDTTHYIRMHRVAKAKQMLADTDLSMVEIQIACGFETPSYFSRVFRADVGSSPSEYRRNIFLNEKID